MKSTLKEKVVMSSVCIAVVVASIIGLVTAPTDAEAFQASLAVQLDQAQLDWENHDRLEQDLSSEKEYLDNKLSEVEGKIVVELYMKHQAHNKAENIRSLIDAPFIEVKEPAAEEEVFQ